MSEASLALYAVSVLGISLSGVMMPGPTTAVTISNGARKQTAGALVAAGHAMVEMPMIVLIFFGFGYLLDMAGVRIAVGFAGGTILIWMAFQVLKAHPASSEKESALVGRGPLAAGAITSLTNPYFYVWWATVGAALVMDAHDFGHAGILTLGAVHWLADAAWLLLISVVVFRTKRFWTPVVHRAVFGFCALVLAAFGIRFIIASFGLVLGWP